MPGEAEAPLPPGPCGHRNLTGSIPGPRKGRSDLLSVGIEQKPRQREPGSLLEEMLGKRGNWGPRGFVKGSISEVTE